MTGPAMESGALWGASLAAALIGAERAPAPARAGPLEGLAASGDAGGDLLAQIGACGAYHLAGSGLGPDALAPFEPLEAVGPEVPPLAAARLVALLGTGGAQAGLVREWCGIAAERGLRLPPELIPLLEAFRGTADQGAATQAIAGIELDWLRRACGDVPLAAGEAAEESPDDETGGAAGPSPSAAMDGRDWTEGSPSGRRDAFVAFRQRDPEAARAALGTVFKSEKAEMREQLVTALHAGLSAADEPFLESCLDDRAGGVRRAAQRLLPLLPGSRFMERMSARATAALRIDETRKMLVARTHTLVVTLPDEAPDLVRDGIEPSQYDWKKRGRKAQLLVQVLQHAPLKAYAAHPPRLWIEQALKGEWAEPLIDGLLAALWRERDPAWRDALIGTLREAHSGKLSGVKPTGEVRHALARAMGTLSAAEWEGAVAPMLKSPGLDLVLAAMDHGPEAYSPGFTMAVLDWLALRARGGPESIGPIRKGNLLARLGNRADPSETSEAATAAIVSRLPEDFDSYLRHQLTHLAETLSLRATMRREFATA